jgi:hypothetical protein
MSSLPYRAALMAASLCLSLAWGGAHAQAAAAVFKFPREPGSLQLRDEPCRDAKIIGLYEGDVPEPFFAGTLDLNGRVLGGCWYQADGHVFFTDSEGDLLVPQPLIGAFVPAENLRQTTLTVSPAAPPVAGPRHISPRPPPAGTAQ